MTPRCGHECPGRPGVTCDRKRAHKAPSHRNEDPWTEDNPTPVTLYWYGPLDPDADGRHIHESPDGTRWRIWTG